MNIDFIKKCPCCKKLYNTSARNQKFCSPECRKKYNKKLSDNRHFQNEHKEFYRLKARSHSLAVECLKFYDFLNNQQPCCSECKTTESLECHHKDFNFLNNQISNLTWLCRKCHSKIHSESQVPSIETAYFMNSKF